MDKLYVLSRELRRLPEGTLYLKQGPRYTAFVQYTPVKDVARSSGPASNTASSGVERNINRNMDLVYLLARKKYLSLYIPVLKGCDRSELDRLLTKYAKAGLDISRITLTPMQYKWIHDKYPMNPFRPEDKKYASISGVKTRSKSEREILNQYELLGIPTRYEMALEVDLSSLLPELEKYTAAFRNGKGLFHYSSGMCFWNVPPELSWMNMRGSIWRSFDPRTGTVIIYPDYSTLTCDNKIIYHEHEGVASNPLYRCTASDRVFVLRETGTVSAENLITTFECDLTSSGQLKKTLETRVFRL